MNITRPMALAGGILLAFTLACGSGEQVEDPAPVEAAPAAAAPEPAASPPSAAASALSISEVGPVPDSISAFIPAPKQGDWTIYQVYSDMDGSGLTPSNVAAFLVTSVGDEMSIAEMKLTPRKSDRMSLWSRSFFVADAAKGSYARTAGSPLMNARVRKDLDQPEPHVVAAPTSYTSGNKQITLEPAAIDKVTVPAGTWDKSLRMRTVESSGTLTTTKDTWWTSEGKLAMRSDIKASDGSGGSVLWVLVDKGNTSDPHAIAGPLKRAEDAMKADH